MADVSITVAVEGGDAAKAQLAGLTSATEAVTNANKTQQSLDEARAYTASLNTIAQQKRIDLDYEEAVRIDALRDHTQGLIQAYNDAQGAASGSGASLSEALDKITLNSQYARREIMMLGREIVSGDLSRAPMTLSSLVFHSNALSLLTNPIALGVIAVGVAIGTLITAAAQGAKEVEAMNLALAATSDFAGMTRQAMMDMAEQVSRSSELTIGVSKDLVTQIVASGRYSSDNVALLAKLVDDYATATGMSADKAGAALVKMFESPAKASETLNEKYHYLSVSELERIKTLEATGHMQEAVTLALADLDKHIGGYSQNVGYFAKAWDGAKQALSGFWDSLKGIGRDNTLDQQIAQVQSSIKILQATGGAGFWGGDVLANKQAVLAALEAQRDQQTAIAVQSGKDAQQNALAFAAHKEIEKSQLAQIQNVKNQIALVQSGPDEVGKTQRLIELNKQLGSLQAGLGADARALSAGAESDATKLWEIQSKSDIDTLNAKLKIGEISKQAHDAEVLAIDLETIKRKTADEQEILSRGGLTALQKQQHEDRIAQLGAEATARQTAYDNSQLIEANKLLVTQAEVSAKAAAATVASQDKVNASLADQIQKQKDHNDAIGQTKSQVEALTAAELDRRIAGVQYDIDTARADNEHNDAAEAYIARLETTKHQLQELQHLQQIGSALQEAADAKKKETAQEDIRIARDVSLTLQDQKDRLLALRDSYVATGDTNATKMRDVGKAINEVDRLLVEHQQKVWGLGFTWKGVSDTIDATITQARTSVATNLSSMLKGHEDFRTAVQNIWHGLGNFIVDEMAKLVVSEAFIQLKKWFSGMFSDMFSGVGETIWASIKPIASPIMDMFSGLFKGVGQMIWDFLSPAFSALSSMFGGLLSGVVKGIASQIGVQAAAGEGGSILGGLSNIASLAVKGWQWFSGGTGAGAVSDLTAAGGGFVTAADAAQLYAATGTGMGATAATEIGGGVGLGAESALAAMGPMGWAALAVGAMMMSGGSGAGYYDVAWHPVYGPYNQDLQSNGPALGYQNIFTGAFMSAAEYYRIHPEVDPARNVGTYSFATGGEMLVTRPTLIRTGEVGPERVNVSPLMGATHSGGSGANITNNFNGPFVSDAYGMKLFLKGQQRLLQRGGF